MQLFLTYLISLFFSPDKIAIASNPLPAKTPVHTAKMEVFKPAPPVVACDTGFIRRIGNFGSNEEVFFFLPDGSGNYYICGRQDNRSIIIRVDPTGNILTIVSFDLTPGDDFVANLMVDSDGNIVGSARDQPNSNTVNVFFKINWSPFVISWSKRLEDPAYNRFDRVFQHPVSGNYFFYGGTTAGIDDYIVELDEDTGDPIWQFASDYGGNADVYTSHFVTNNAIYYAGQGRLGAGLDEIRPTLTKFDLNGNLQWARIHLRSPSQPSRLYNMDVLLENDTIVTCGRGSLSGDDLTFSELLFYKTNSDGELIMAKSYTVAGGTGTAGYRIHSIPGGYIVQGNFEDSGVPRMFVARLDKLGNVVWARKILTATSAAGVTKPLTLIEGDFVVFATQTTQFDSGQNHDFLFGKISLDGNLTDSDCPLIEDITLVANNVSNPYDGSQLPSVYTPNYVFSSNSFSAQSTNLSLFDIPNCECLDVIDSCLEEINLDLERPCPFAFDGKITVQPVDGLQPFTYAWENDTVFTNQLTGLDVGTYSVTVTDANGCSVTGSVELEAAERPDVSSEVEDASCFGVNDGKLTIIADDTSLLFSVRGFATSSQTVYESLWPGGDQFFTIDTFGCEWTNFYLIDAPDKIQLDLPSSVEAPMCDSVQIEASSNASSPTWVWSPPDHLSCMDCPYPVAAPFTTTTYYLTVTDSSGCSASDSIHVRVDFDGRAYIPNAFSPNGDGLNDNFHVLGYCVAKVQLLQVFDRWGEKVFEASNTPPNDPLQGWDGKFRGKYMNSDVFTYHVIVSLYDGSVREYKGDVTLLR